MFGELRAAGITHYVAFINRFAAERAIGEMDCVYSSWMADGEGFSDADIDTLERLMPFLGLALKSASLGRIAETLVVTYLGRDAGRRVLRGQIRRGVAERIEAVLWFSDLRSYTRISDTSSPDEIIPMLNDYGEAVVAAVHENGGDVLKLIGDGVLAIFPAERPSGACAAALAAAKSAQKAVTGLNSRRAADRLPFTDMYLGLHIGEVFYGNIGSNERLDFTVIGPAVNEVSRITAMCRSVDQPLLLSAAFAAAATEGDEPFVSVGRYALRGVGRPQDLYTLERRY
jgi:adenylate cyclase